MEKGGTHSTGLRKNAVTKIVCHGHFSCQRKMHADYPSVAKPCTSESFPGIQEDLTEAILFSLENHEKQGTSPGFLPSTPALSRFSWFFLPILQVVLSLTPALAPKML
jgi:hypothetical protein